MHFTEDGRPKRALPEKVARSMRAAGWRTYGCPICGGVHASRRVTNRTEAGGVVEYVLLVALVCLATFAALSWFGTQLEPHYRQGNAGFDPASSVASVPLIDPPTTTTSSTTTTTEGP